MLSRPGVLCAHHARGVSQRMRELAPVTAFQPRMQARRRGIRVLGEPLRHESRFGLVEIWRACCEAGAAGDYVSLDPRLFIVLDPLEAEVALDGGPAGSAASSKRSVSFVPAGAPLRLSVEARTEIRHLDLHFDPGGLGPIEGLDGARAATPRLMFTSDRVQRLARLLAAACGSSGPLCRHRDGLVEALLGAAFAQEAAPSRRSPLSDEQLGLAIERIEERCAGPVRLRELASLTRLSESYFSHAFKAATGMPPHRWQLQARVRRAKALLSAGDAPLTEIAGAVGFADQPHFTRVFRTLAGCTPAAWRAMSRRPSDLVPKRRRANARET